MFNRLRQFPRRGRDEEGAVAVELGILLPVLLLLIVGGMDLGHRYYIQYLTSNASREGARYAAKHTVASTPPDSTAISNYVKLSSGLNYSSFNLSNLNVTGSFSGTFPNKIVIVTVKADKNWWLLGNLFGFTNQTRVTATTAMNVEY